MGLVTEYQMEQNEKNEKHPMCRACDMHSLMVRESKSVPEQDTGLSLEASEVPMNHTVQKLNSKIQDESQGLQEK